MCEVHDSQLKMVVKIDDLLTSLYITVTLPACLLRVTTVTIFVDCKLHPVKIEEYFDDQLSVRSSYVS